MKTDKEETSELILSLLASLDLIKLSTLDISPPYLIRMLLFGITNDLHIFNILILQNTLSNSKLGQLTTTYNNIYTN